MCAYKRAIGDRGSDRNDVSAAVATAISWWWCLRGVLHDVITGENRERVDESSVFFLKTVRESITISK